MKFVRKQLVVVPLLLLLLLIATFLICFYHNSLSRASKIARKNAWLLLRELERWATEDENSFYPVDLEALFTTGYLNAEKLQNPFEKRQIKTNSAKVSYSDAKDFYRGRKPLQRSCCRV